MGACVVLCCVVLSPHSLPLYVCVYGVGCAHTHNIDPQPSPITTHSPAAGVIREEGGKMLMLQRRWSEAYTEFNEAFRAYQARGTWMITFLCVSWVGGWGMCRAVCSPVDPTAHHNAPYILYTHIHVNRRPATRARGTASSTCQTTNTTPPA